MKDSDLCSINWWKFWRKTYFC